MTAFRVGLANAIFLLVIIAVIGLIAFGDGSPQLPDSSMLVVNPKGIIVEQKALVSPIDKLTKASDSSPKETLAREVIDAVLRAKPDKAIRGIVLNLTELDGGSLPLLNAIGEALLSFRSAEKKCMHLLPVLAKANTFWGVSPTKSFLTAIIFIFLEA